MADEGEVRIKLVVDDLSKAVVEGVKQGFAQVHGEVAKTEHAAGDAGLAGAVLKGNTYFELMKRSVGLVAEGAKQAFEFTEKLADAALEAAENQDKQERAMAGAMFLLDRGQHSMGELRSYATGLREEFEQFGMRVGVANEKLTDAFNTIVERGQLGTEAAKELTLQMATVGKVVPGGMDSLAQGFSMLELGMVRARNPVVQLIAATHTLKGTARDVAEQMQKMSPEEQLRLGQEAIAKQAEALKRAGAQPPTMAALRTSFEGVKESFLESMGQPMIDALVPHLARLRDYLVDHIEQIKAFGEKVGKEVGRAIDFLSEIVGGVYDAFAENWDEVKGIVDSITSEFQGMWGGSMKHAGAIAHTFKDIAVDFIHAMKWVADTMHAVTQALADVLEKIPGVGGLVRGARAEHAEEAARGAARGVGEAGNAEFERQVEVYRAQAAAAGKSSEEIQRTINSMRDWHNQFASDADAVAAATAHADFAATADYIQKAIDTGNEGSLAYASSLLMGSEEARKAFALGEVHVRGGLQALISALGDKTPELAAKLREAANAVKQQGGIKAPGHAVHFYGATFNVKQDFRDQNPDRVVLTFRRDIARAAASRIQARVGSPFGV